MQMVGGGRGFAPVPRPGLFYPAGGNQNSLSVKDWVTGDRESSFGYLTNGWMEEIGDV